MEERCPKCGSILVVVDCCGGGIWYCEKCKDYYYYGELISEEEAICEIPPLDDLKESEDKPS